MWVLLVIPFIFFSWLIFLILLFGVFFKNAVNLFKIFEVLKLSCLAGLILLSLLFIRLSFFLSTLYYDVVLFDFLFKSDLFVLLIQISLVLFSVIYLILCENYDKDLKVTDFEYLLLFLLFLFGALCLVLADDFLSFYLCLELQTIPFYVLIAKQKHSKTGLEAAIKYFILSLISSAVFVFGVGIIYSVSGCLSFADLNVFNSLIFELIFHSNNETFLFFKILLLCGLVCLLISFFFKLAAAPFHFWTPDVYTGAPISITLLMSTLPKYSAFVAFSHILFGPFIYFFEFWSPCILAAGFLSIIVGVLGAFYYNKISRIVAFGSTAHVGFVLLGLGSIGEDALFLSSYYFLSYLLGSFLFFGLWLNTSRKIYPVFISEFSSLLSSSKFYATLFVFCLFSFAGIPPFIGFFAKVLIFKGLLLNYSVFFAISVVAISVISAVYYLRITKFVFIVDKSSQLSTKKFSGFFVVISLVFLGSGIFFIPLLFFF